MDYTGVDNLEVMADAVKYNKYLTDAVVRELPAGSSRVLDFGAGTGTFAARVREATGLPVDCVETDPGLQTRLREAGHAAAGSAGELPGGYDLAYTLNVLEHIPDHATAAKELFGALRPGGTVVAYVPAFQVLFSSMDVKVGHVRRYRRAGLLRLFQEAGFAVQRCEYVDSLGFFAALAYRAKGGSDGQIDPRALRAFDRWIFPVSRGLDTVTRRGFGKNLLLVGTRPSA